MMYRNMLLDLYMMCNTVTSYVTLNDKTHHHSSRCAAGIMSDVFAKRLSDNDSAGDRERFRESFASRDASVHQQRSVRSFLFTNQVVDNHHTKSAFVQVTQPTIELHYSHNKIHMAVIIAHHSHA